MLPKKIAPPSKPIQIALAQWSFSLDPETIGLMLRPRPLPKYSKPASNAGETLPTNNLAKGVLAPNKLPIS